MFIIKQRYYGIKNIETWSMKHSVDGSYVLLKYFFWFHVNPFFLVDVLSSPK